MFGLNVMHTFPTSLDSCVAFYIFWTPIYSFFQNAKIFKYFIDRNFKESPGDVIQFLDNL